MTKLFTLLLGMILCISQGFSQARTVTGKVTGPDGTPVNGATVTVRGTTTATTTDAEGNFSISVGANARALIISYVGMVDQEISIAGRNAVAVSMQSQARDLEEVVVVAYGTAKKGTFTGTTAQINAKEIENRPLANVTRALDGAAPGIQTTASSGQPGSGQAVRIRGFGSINASNAPLYVVDGVPYDASIANLNVDDVESISVLKDAASSALYGSRAANGVVMITTKKGKKNRNQMSVRVSGGISSRGIPEYDRVNAYDYYPLMWEADRNSLAYRASNPVPLDQASQTATGRIVSQLILNPFNVPNNQVVGVDGKLNPSAQLKWADDLDWTKELIRQGSREDYGINFSGGNDRSDYFVSMGYLKENGFTIRSDYRRWNGRVNLNTQPVKWFKAGVNLAGTITNSNQASDGSSTGFVNPFFFSRNIGPIYPVYAHDPTSGEYLLDANGNQYYDYGFNTRPAFAGRHVIAETKMNENQFKRNVLSARAYGTVFFTDYLKLTTNISTDISDDLIQTYENKEVGDGAPSGRSYREAGKTSSYTFNQLLEFNKTYGRHTVGALAGHENYSLTYNLLSGRRVDQILDGNTELINFTTINSLTSRTDRHTIESFFGRVNYSFDDKYLLSASIRRDGNSRFSPESRWGTFWSVGGGWRMDREAFMADATWIDQLKLRASYGTVGNDAGIGYFPYQGLYEIRNNALEPGYIQSNLENRDLTWEVNKSFDIGVDFALFKNRLTGTIEYFNRASDALIFDVPLPISTGMTSITKNIGSMYNRGIEVQLGGDVIRNKNFNWNLVVNATSFVNKVTKLPDGQEEIISGTKKLMAGKSIYDFWLRQWYGVDPTDGAALYVADNRAPGTTGLRIPKAGDTVSISQNNGRFGYNGSAIPDVYGSVNTTFRLYRFELGVLFTYQIGGKVYDGTYASLMHSGTWGNALHTDIMNRWQKPGDITNTPRMDAAQTAIFGAQSDRWLVDASYMNIRTINLQYNLTPNFLGKIKASAARIYVAMENVALLTKRKGMNVNQSFAGTTSNAYPPARIITGGINITF